MTDVLLNDIGEGKFTGMTLHEHRKTFEIF